MNLDILTTTSRSDNSNYRTPVDLTMNISTRVDAKAYGGTVELKHGAVKITTDSGESATAPVSGAPPVVVAIDLLKALAETQHNTPTVPYTGAALYKYDVR